ncbi:cytochrome P450 2A5-like isoform X3 [Microcaecilia unicolor]|uniref:Cytochrome P450 2A5-like isoform X3 n=1 Tax=Microcaecilia unicolor TaxID=1415580 RepID=A0A6P7Z485_9AMPH|nr:cytochrome P450 2A5-like isoform X3 [Microcaecilia unicolor]
MYQRDKLPPGPTPLPFIGNLLQIDTNGTAKGLMKMSEKYGPVFRLYIGPEMTVILSGYEAVKEALIDQAEVFGGRGKTEIFEQAVQGFGMTFTNGEIWKQTRQFSIMTLKDFGVGKRGIEERIQEEAQFLLEEIRKTKELPFDPTTFFSQAVSNVICSIVFGSRFDYDDKEFHHLLQMINESYCVISSMWGKEKQNSSSHFNMKSLTATVLALFFAGTETTSTTLRYGFLILLKYPEIEERLHEEIDHAIDREQSPCQEDLKRMPYTNAVIHEIQRFSDLIPLNLPHQVTQDTHFRGYMIPKGTQIFPLLHSVLRDPTQFSDPDSFNPGHFLDEKGNFKKRDAFMPFSAGKRICPGEGLARMELFVFLVSILQNFSLKSNKHPKDIDISPAMSNLLSFPRFYEVSFVPR